MRNERKKKEKSARTKKKKKENCIGLSHHNINMKETKNHFFQSEILMRRSSTEFKTFSPRTDSYSSLVFLFFSLSFLLNGISISTKTFRLISSSINVNFSRYNIAKWHEHRCKFGITEFLWQMVDKEIATVWTKELW